MKILLTLLTALLISSTLLFAGPARGGVLTFSQPDGTTFQGYLKGTSAFNWIESEGKVIKYNQDDKFYHIAIFDSNNSLVLTDNLPTSYMKNAPSRLATPKSHSVASKTSKKLMNLYNQKRTDSSPE